MKHSGKAGKACDPVHGHWYEEDPELLQLEISCLNRFRSEYGADNVSLVLCYDPQGRMAVNGILRFRMKNEKPWQIWKFVMIYEHDYPKRYLKEMFYEGIRFYVLGTVEPDGSLKPITREAPHVMWDSKAGRCNISLECETASDKTNGYYILRRFLCWLFAYNFWLEKGSYIN